MKTKLIAFTASLILTAALAFGHGGVEIGPNGGRLLELGKNPVLHAEVTLKDDKFHVAVLDKALKPVELKEQTLTATGGTRQKPEKLTVEKTAEGFVIPAVKPGQWLIMQFKENAKAKAVTARMEYNTENCDACDSEEWVCKCEANKEKEKEKDKKK